MFKAQTSLVSTTVLLLVLLLVISYFFYSKTDSKNYEQEFLEISLNELLKTEINNVSFLQKLMVSYCEDILVTNSGNNNDTLFYSIHNKSFEKELSYLDAKVKKINFDLIKPFELNYSHHYLNKYFPKSIYFFQTLTNNSNGVLVKSSMSNHLKILNEEDVFAKNNYKKSMKINTYCDKNFTISLSLL